MTAGGVDAVILGSGFSGSLLGWILARQGWHVTIIDPARHPRFAIGESSTPAADVLLAHLAERWGLEGLAPLARWGSWKRTYPRLVCGKKRGFSYYRHRRDRPFGEAWTGEHSLLVAASGSDEVSDTHWLRSSVDGFIAARAVRAGARLWEAASVREARRDRHDGIWKLRVDTEAGPRRVTCRWLIDASGAAAATARFIDNRTDDNWMATRTRATFGHFRGVGGFATDVCPRAGFAGDDAAQHHLFGDRWCWVLRMDNGVTSVGIVEPVGPGRSAAERPAPGTSPGNAVAAPPAETWRDWPSLAEMMSGARAVDPGDGPRTSGRLSRCRRRAAGDGWVLLPTTYGFVDPLHSTGIGHALSGVARVAEILTGRSRQIPEALRRYERDLRDEIRWIDTLVSGCYAALPSFRRFTAFASFYFVAAIEFEKTLHADPRHWGHGFLSHRNTKLRETAEGSREVAGSRSIGAGEFVERVRSGIAPWNDSGLLCPQTGNRLARTAASK